MMNYKLKQLIYKIFNLKDRAIYMMCLPEHTPYVVFEGKTDNLNSTGATDDKIYHYRFAMKHSLFGFVWFSYTSKMLKDLRNFDIKLSGNNIYITELIGVYPFKNNK